MYKKVAALKKWDAFLSTVGISIVKVREAIDRLSTKFDEKHEEHIVNRAFALAEQASAKVGKAEDKVSDLLDDKFDVASAFIIKMEEMRAEYKKRVKELSDAQKVLLERLDEKIKVANGDIVAAEDDFDALARHLDEEFGVDVMNAQDA